MSTITPPFESPRFEGPAFDLEHKPDIEPGPNKGEPPREPAMRWVGHWTPRRLVLAVVAAWLLSGVYLIAADQQAVETLFGKVVAPRVLPGLHYALPWPIESVTKLKVRQLQ